MDQYPIYFKSTEQGLYFRLEGPFNYTQIRLKKSSLGKALAFTQTECSEFTTTFMQDGSFEPSSKDEFMETLLAIIEEIRP